jgi:hypothetical protein
LSWTFCICYAQQFAPVVHKLFHIQSTLKQLDEMELNLTGMLHGWFSTLEVILVPIRNTALLLGPILLSDSL